MFTVNIKGKQNSKNENLVKLELIFFKTGYARVTKSLAITDQFKDWDNTAQSFKSKSGDCITKNKNLLNLRLRYQKVAEDWDAEERIWAPVELSHCFDEQEEKKNEVKIMSVCQMIDFLIDKFNKKERIKNGQIVDSSNNAKAYVRLKKNLSEFTKQQYNRSFSSYFFKDIDETFLLDYTMYTKKKGIEEGNKGGFTSKLRRLRAVCSHAKKMEMNGVNIDALECLGDNIKWDETTSKAVSAQNIYKIENIDRSLFSNKELLHLNLFLFSYYSGGMANVDVCNLTWDCIKDGRIIMNVSSSLKQPSRFSLKKRKFLPRNMSGRVIRIMYSLYSLENILLQQKKRLV